MLTAPAFRDSLVLDGAPAKPQYWSFHGVYAVRAATALGAVTELVGNHRGVTTPLRWGTLVPAEASGAACRAGYERRWLVPECVATYGVHGTCMIPDALDVF